jgi:S-adenosylmethionine synthetase
VQLAYAIGIAEPVSIMVDTFGTCTAPEQNIQRAIRKVFDLTPRAIIAALGLLAPIYLKTASGGHFGRTSTTERVGDRDLTYFTWERTDRVDQLLAAIGH